MTVRNDHYEIGPTADLVSYWRGLTRIPLADQISEAASSRGIAEDIFKKNLPKLDGDKAIAALDGISSRGVVFIEARYRGVDRQIDRTGFKHIYEAASGICPRGINRTADPDVRYLATDLPERLPKNERLLRSIMVKNGITRPNLHFSSVNVLDREALIEAANYLAGQPIALIHEGLLPYFNDDEKHIFGENVRHLLERTGGVWITPDIMCRYTLRNRIDSLPPEKREVAELTISTMASGSGGRNVIDNAFETEAHADRFFEELGFVSDEKPLMYDGSFDLSSLQKIPPEQREDLIGGFLKQIHIYVVHLK